MHGCTRPASTSGNDGTRTRANLDGLSRLSRVIESVLCPVGAEKGSGVFFSSEVGKRPVLTAARIILRCQFL